METGKNKSIPINRPQMHYNIVMPNLASLIWGRFGGKTEGPGARFVANNIEKMPRSNGFVQGVTYEQLLTQTLPGLIAGLEKLGYIENKHFWVRNFPDEKLLLPKAIRAPLKADHYISFYNGSGIYMVSQDRASTIHGVRTQWGFIDEAKKINKKKFDEETIPTMAGGNELWGTKAPVHLAEYLSLLFCSDMPTTSEARWLLDFEKEMDPHLVKLIMQVHCEITKNKSALLTAEGSSFDKIQKRISYLESEYNELRRDCIYYSEASALENIQFVGLQPLKKAKLVLSDWQFRISILNERSFKNEKGFYAMLDPQIHGYLNVNYSYVDPLFEKHDFKSDKSRDCRWDGDIVQDEPLHIAFDHNNVINCVATNQRLPTGAPLLSTFYVDHPLLLIDCVIKWDDYYKYHKCKELHYWHDSTSISGGKNARSNINFADEVIKKLTDLGWDVIVHDIGQIGGHTSRYHFWGTLFGGEDPRLPRFTYNKKNCETWEFAAQQAGLIRSGKEYKKDKRPELNKSIPPHEATHITEAVDVLYFGQYKDRFRQSDEYVSMIHA